MLYQKISYHLLDDISALLSFIVDQKPAAALPGPGQIVGEK